LIPVIGRMGSRKPLSVKFTKKKSRRDNLDRGIQGRPGKRPVLLKITKEGVLDGQTSKIGKEWAAGGARKVVVTFSALSESNNNEEGKSSKVRREKGGTTAPPTA